MRRPINMIRVSLAIVLVMAIGLLPHHHHHGAPCWAFNQCSTHHHTDTCPSDDGSDAPCNEHSCYLQTIKIFTATHRMEVTQPVNIDFLPPDEIAFIPNYFIIHHYRITDICYPLLSGIHLTQYLRGPPVC